MPLAGQGDEMILRGKVAFVDNAGENTSAIIEVESGGVIRLVVEDADRRHRGLENGMEVEMKLRLGGKAELPAEIMVRHSGDEYTIDGHTILYSEPLEVKILEQK
jgi:hypothetical protein